MSRPYCTQVDSAQYRERHLPAFGVQSRQQSMLGFSGKLGALEERLAEHCVSGGPIAICGVDL